MSTWNLNMPLARWFWKVGTKVSSNRHPMREVLVSIFCLAVSLQGQNLDLFSKTSSAIHRGLAGAGLALVEGNNSGDINPAGLAGIQEQQISATAFIEYYKYELVNERLEEGLTRIFDWAKLQRSIQSLHFASPLGKQTGISLGIGNLISPFLYNQKRAVTWSPLFNQLTHGDIHKPHLSLGHLITSDLSIGVTANLVFGSIRSEVHGENHGNDEDKWATLKSSLSGWGFKTGLHFQRENYQIGVAFEPSMKVDIQYQQAVSSDSLYRRLFPESENSTWLTPMRLGLGTAIKINDEIIATLDVERFELDSKTPQFNLFEYGGLATGGDIFTYRVGLLYERDGLIPISVGYAYLPQSYTSTMKTILADNSAEISNGDRILNQLYTIGISKSYSNSSLNIVAEYSVLTWKGDLHTYITVKDAYTEQGFGLFLEWVVKI